VREDDLLNLQLAAPGTHEQVLGGGNAGLALRSARPGRPPGGSASPARRKLVDAQQALETAEDLEPGQAIALQDFDTTAGPGLLCGVSHIAITNVEGDGGLIPPGGA